MNICLHCAHADLKANPTYSKLGLVRCTHISKKEYGESTFMALMFERECPDYVEASQEIITARDSWNTKRIA